MIGEKRTDLDARVKRDKEPTTTKTTLSTTTTGATVAITTTTKPTTTTTTPTTTTTKPATTELTTTTTSVTTLPPTTPTTTTEGTTSTTTRSLTQETTTTRGASTTSKTLTTSTTTTSAGTTTTETTSTTLNPNGSITTNPTIATTITPNGTVTIATLDHTTGIITTTTPEGTTTTEPTATTKTSATTSEATSTGAITSTTTTTTTTNQAAINTTTPDGGQGGPNIALIAGGVAAGALLIGAAAIAFSRRKRDKPNNAKEFSEMVMISFGDSLAIDKTINSEDISNKLRELGVTNPRNRDIQIGMALELHGLPISTHNITACKRIINRRAQIHSSEYEQLPLAVKKICVQEAFRLLDNKEDLLLALDKHNIVLKAIGGKGNLKFRDEYASTIVDMEEATYANLPPREEDLYAEPEANFAGDTYTTLQAEALYAAPELYVDQEIMPARRETREDNYTMPLSTDDNLEGTLQTIDEKFSAVCDLEEMSPAIPSKAAHYSSVKVAGEDNYASIADVAYTDAFAAKREGERFGDDAYDQPKAWAKAEPTYDVSDAADNNVYHQPKAWAKAEPTYDAATNRFANGDKESKYVIARGEVTESEADGYVEVSDAEELPNTTARTQSAEKTGGLRAPSGSRS